jgi:phosphohistidine phosphatase
MELLIIRHAIALERADFAKSGESDDKRPLTDEGRQKMKRNARGLRELVPRVDVLGTSPLVRARQTAAIVAQIYDVPEETTDVLKPDSAFSAFAKWLTKHKSSKVVAAVGHEPHLSSLATWLITGSEASGIELKKGGACLISFGKQIEKGKGTLEWLVTPRQLVRLAE